MPDLQAMLEDQLRRAVAAAFGPEHAGVDPLVRPSSNPAFGDYQANLAMGLAKTLKQKPRDAAQKIVAALAPGAAADASALFEKVEVAGPGFINLTLRPAFLESQVQAVASDPRLGVPAAPPQRVVVDYSGPNVAKEMHVGHLRSSVIGDAIARVLAFQGHEVIRQNHLGDWGTQFGMLIQELIDRGHTPASMDARILADLNAFYQRAKQRFDSDPAFAERARQRVVQLQAGEPTARQLWQALIEESTRHFNAVYGRLGVLLTDADLRPESFYNPMLPAVVQELQDQGLARDSQGALCVFPPGFLNEDGSPRPVMVRKSDGGFNYDTTDLAGLRYRIGTLHAQRIIYVTDARQRDHFAMVFKVAEMAGWTQTGVRLDHVPFGTVMGEDRRPFKTRSGDVVKLADLLDEAEERAAAVIREKNPEMSAEQQKQVAHAVGIGAIKYADLVNDRVKDYVFDWNRMLAFDGNTAPYLQNAYVRIRSIFRKGQAQGVVPSDLESKPIHLATPAERALALKVLQLPGVIAGVAQSLEPHRLCGYLYELAAGYHQFYEACPVLSAPDTATRESRLRLCEVTARVLKLGLSLLGIDVIEQM